MPLQTLTKGWTLTTIEAGEEKWFCKMIPNRRRMKKNTICK